jgi:shikimate kinase
MASGDSFTTCGFGGSVVPPPQAVNAVTNNSDVIFLIASFLYVRKLLKKKLSKPALEFGNSALIFFKSQGYLYDRS